MTVTSEIYLSVNNYSLFTSRAVNYPSALIAPPPSPKLQLFDTKRCFVTLNSEAPLFNLLVSCRSSQQPLEHFPQTISVINPLILSLKVTITDIDV